MKIIKAALLIFLFAPMIFFQGCDYFYKPSPSGSKKTVSGIKEKEAVKEGEPTGKSGEPAEKFESPGSSTESAKESGFSVYKEKAAGAAAYAGARAGSGDDSLFSGNKGQPVKRGFVVEEWKEITPEDQGIPGGRMKSKSSELLPMEPAGGESPVIPSQNSKGGNEERIQEKYHSK